MTKHISLSFFFFNFSVHLSNIHITLGILKTFYFSLFIYYFYFSFFSTTRFSHLIFFHLYLLQHLPLSSFCFSFSLISFTRTCSHSSIFQEPNQLLSKNPTLIFAFLYHISWVGLQKCDFSHLIGRRTRLQVFIKRLVFPKTPL